MNEMYKPLFWGALLIVILEGFLLYKSSFFFSSAVVNGVLLPPSSFYDEAVDTPQINSDSLVSASGSWVSTTDLAQPLSTSNIDCWKSFGHCFIATATLDEDGAFLSSNLDLVEIAEWQPNYIQTQPSKAVCTESTYRIDRISKVITFTRRTTKTTGDLCSGVQSEPIISTLEDGQKRIEAWRRNQ